MRKFNARTVLIGAGGLMGAALLYAGYASMYASPRDEIKNEIAGVESSIARLEKQAELRAKAESALRAAGATTLGAQLDVVEHRLRTGLNRILEQEGLQGIVIDTFEPHEEESPLTRARGVPPAIKKILNATPDFSAIRATVRGSGTLEQATRCVAVIQSQPWLHRVDSLSLKPVGKERRRFEVRMEVASLFLPAYVPKDLADPVIAGPGEEAVRYAAVAAARNVFTRPQPNAPAVAQATPDAPAVPPVVTAFPPYEDWKLSGLMTGRSGLTIIMVNSKSGESRAIRPGDSVLDAVFIEGAGERAVFEIGGKRFEVTNGETLASRRPQG